MSEPLEHFDSPHDPSPSVEEDHEPSWLEVGRDAVPTQPIPHPYPAMEDQRSSWLKEIPTSREAAPTRPQLSAEEREAQEKVARAHEILWGTGYSGPILEGADPKLFRRTDRMARFYRWVQEDPEIAEVFDTALKNRARAASRKQAVISVVIAIVSLIAGWLLNAISPLNFTNLFHP